MQTNYLSIIPVISKFEIPKGFGVIDKNVPSHWHGPQRHLWRAMELKPDFPAQVAEWP